MRVFFYFLFACSFPLNAQFYNGSQQEFGKNRVQYYEFDWRQQNYERFKIYFYRGGEKMAEFAAKSIQRELLLMEEKLNFFLPEHLEFLVFKSLTDLRQSNIGLTNENEAKYGGKSQLIGSKLLLYYTGNHPDFQQQIKKVLAEAVLKNILYGKQWSDVLIETNTNKHPLWFTEGFVAYLSQPWNADFEALVKDGFLTGKYNDFSKLDENNSRVAGQAFWMYLEEMYGKSQVLNVIKMIEIVGQVDRSLLYVLGSDLKLLLPNFANYYKKRFLSDLHYQEERTGQEQKIRLKKNEKITWFSVSKDADQLAYVLNREGRYRIFLENVSKAKRIKLTAKEPRLSRIQDESYPVLCFHPNGKFVAYFSERKGKLIFSLYDIEEKSTSRKEVPKLEKILSCDYSQDGQTILISGVKNGQTDLYLYKISGNSLDALTDDIWDDLYPKFTLDNKHIVFSSNRSSDTLKKEEAILPSDNSLDLFLFDLKKKDKHQIILKRLTNTPIINERQAQEQKHDLFYYLSDENGLWNRWKLEKDSVISFIDTMIHYRFDNKTSAVSNLTTGISMYQLAPNQEVFSKVKEGNRDIVFRSPVDEGKKESNPAYFFAKHQEAQKVVEPNISVDTAFFPLDSLPVKIEISADGKYEKQTLVLYQSQEEYNQQAASVQNRLEYQEALRTPLKLNFAKDFISAKVDNSFLGQAYQRYFGEGSVYQNPALSGLLRISFSDVMEDIVLSGGMRIPTSKNTSEFYTALDFRKKRLDKQFFYYRRSYENREKKELNKQITHEVKFNFNYPFSEVFSWKSGISARTDIAHPLSVDDASLLRKTNYFFQAGAKTSLVFDNAKQWSNNAWSGTRAKIFAELLQDVNSNGLGMLNFGLDLRHSIKLLKEMVWVNRLAFGTSVGNSRLLYFMGGIDNWMLRPKVHFNPDIPVDPSGRFAYQTLATPMRGFMQNQRNGSSFAVFNSELRIPVFQLLTNTTVKNEPLKSFQWIAFLDIGTAWTGKSPFASSNYFNVETINNKPVVIQLVNSREPIIAATGFGIRSKIFGYFVRADLGWGIENGSFNKKPKLFLSLTHDI